MARPGFKRWFTRFVPREVERSTFVLVASLLLLLMYWQWRAVDAVIWDVSGTMAGTLLTALFWIGWVTVLVSTFLIDHFDLFGLRQVYLHFTGQAYHHPPFVTRGLYRFVQHPIMIGFIVAFWATPTMTVGHLIFAATTTAYIFVGVLFEERDLTAILGEPYADYRRRVPRFIPFLKGAGSVAPAQAPAIAASPVETHDH
jgi:protein-S-isoprenylcysteine O-methyltransferase Ste14